METQTKLIWDFRLKLHMTKILMTAIPNIKKFRENTMCNIIDQNILRLPHFRFRNITKPIMAIKELPDIIMIINDKNLQKSANSYINTPQQIAHKWIKTLL